MESHEQRPGLQLLKRSRKRLVQVVFSRTGLVLILLVLQFLLLFALFFWFIEFLPHYYGFSSLFIIVMVLYLLNSSMDPTAKNTWLVIIMITPVFGSLLFLFTKCEFGHRAMKWLMQRIQAETSGLLSTTREAEEYLASEGEGAAALARYLNQNGPSPAFGNTKVTYFPLGEDKFERLLQELRKAEKFIFLEYFIVEEGKMWGEILEILALKAAQGLDVRIMYDGTCEIVLLPKRYPQMLRKLGIQCKVFSPAMPFVSTHYNYRDHRKIAVIDGKVAFNGGINLADEYINHKTLYGRWKDTAVMLEGDAVNSFTLMFLQMWNMDGKAGEYAPFLQPSKDTSVQATGVVIPYGDAPLDGVRTGQHVYMDILYRARKYVHIMTPYLILDGEMEAALKYAADRGVEVKLLLPGIPDKKLIYALSKTHYRSLLDSGVKIFEYVPGFVHAKVFVSDDHEAVVGTINLDYRSLYHHFECATYMNGVSCIDDIEADFAQCLLQSREVTEETIKKEKWYVKLAGGLLKVVAPLL